MFLVPEDDFTDMLSRNFMTRKQATIVLRDLNDDERMCALLSTGD